MPQPVRLDSLPAELADAAGRLADLDRAWATDPECDRAGVDSRIRDQLESSGWLDRWNHPRGVLWVLSAYACASLGVQIGEHWEKQPDGSYLETPNWIPIDADPPNLGTWPYPPPEIPYPNNMLEYVSAHRSGRVDRRRAEPVIDAVTGQPMRLFGCIPVYRDHRAARGQKPPPKRPARRASA